MEGWYDNTDNLNPMSYLEPVRTPMEHFLVIIGHGSSGTATIHSTYGREEVLMILLLQYRKILLSMLSI